MDRPGRRKGRALGHRTLGAALRAAIAVAVVAVPSFVVPTVGVGTAEVVVLTAIIAGAVVALEYGASSPALVEFRHAPPYNRIRVSALASMTLLGAAVIDPASAWAGLAQATGGAVATAFDAPWSPVGALLDAAPAAAGPMAGAAVLCGTVAILAFARVGGWPGERADLNVWANLPTFHARGDAAARLRAHAGVNAALGIGAAYALPSLAVWLQPLHGLRAAENDLLLVWAVALWAFLPTTLILRAIALRRVAAMVAARDASARPSFSLA